MVFGLQLEKFGKNFDLLGHNTTKNWRNTPKISKNHWFSIRIWAAPSLHQKSNKCNIKCFLHLLDFWCIMVLSANIIHHCSFLFILPNLIKYLGLTYLLYSHTPVEHRPFVFSFHRWGFLAWARSSPNDVFPHSAKTVCLQVALGRPRDFLPIRKNSKEYSKVCLISNPSWYWNRCITLNSLVYTPILIYRFNTPFRCDTLIFWCEKL